MKRLIYAVFVLLIFANATISNAETNNSNQTNGKVTSLSKNKKVTLVINSADMIAESELRYKKHIEISVEKGIDNIVYQIVISVDGVKCKYDLNNRVGNSISYNDSLRIVSSTFKYDLQDEEGILKKYK